MDKREIRRIVGEVVMDVLELELEELRDNADFHTDLGGDSIQRLELVVALEKRFGIQYAFSDEARMNCINEVVEITESYVRTQAPL